MSDDARRYRAGDHIDDQCRACKLLRSHTVVAVSPEGGIERVICNYCASQHNYRGGGQPRRSGASTTSAEPTQDPLPVVTERERSGPIMSHDASGTEDLELLLRRVIREEAGVTPVAPAAKWRGGDLVLRPGREGVQEKSWPIETFFQKVVMLRNRLRVLEQQINAADLPDELKLKLQGYITGCYGTLTSFNVLFAEEDDRFHGTGGRG